ncbi:hypothetical protein [Saccharomonospora viridis]|jgi:hypothetical protein|uniref:Uncharacterized protein n=2 Tax=Saccharomonospora viridis TaxID=1852 RepID=A0A837DGS9_9PSEU|nr:hypothetical protein [Saccharomonospora viridis]KHF45096.1 hypothetical protein MINT15_19780 [Saccharomonospora viridis]SFP13530.1 hypothetical protein SAMN02982918_1349 [Saccharomonospora viridis]
MDNPGLLLFALLIVFSVLLVPFLVGSRHKKTDELRDQLHEFARRVGGTEYVRHLPARPSFGYFPHDPKAYANAPFDYAVEFEHRGVNVLAFELERRGNTVGASPASINYDAIVEIPIAPCPFLWIGNELNANTDLKLRKQIIPDLTIGRHHRRIVVASHDEQFARTVVDLELLTWIAERFGDYFLKPIVLEQGVMRTEAMKSVRLEPDRIIPTADALLDLLDKLPPELRVENAR